MKSVAKETTMNTKVLVTGGAGFVGSTLVNRLLRMNYDVTVLDDLSTGLIENLPKSKEVRLIKGDIKDSGLVARVMRKHSYVMHLAAHAFIPLSYEMPL